MKLIWENQDSDKWLDWRRGGIGASEAPVVMGVSPYKTRYQLWEEKCGINDHSPTNHFILQKGKDAEPRARAMYETLFFTEMPAVLAEYGPVPFIRASLDGFNEATMIGIEIKYVGAQEYLRIKETMTVPDRYFPQIQHQLLVTGADHFDFVAYNDEINDIFIITVKPDPDYIKRLVEELMKFWKLVKTRKPPEMCDRDYVVVDDAETLDLIEQWKAVCLQVKTLETKEAELKDKIKAYLPGGPARRFRHADVRICEATRQGSVNYKAIPQLKQVNLDLYRGNPVTYWRFDVYEKTDK